jgi:hypothetical protein
MTSDTISANASASSDVPRTRFGDFLLLAIFLVANAWFTLGNYFAVPEANDWDAYGQLPWMHRWADPSLFPDDFMTDYFQRNHVPPGVKAAYYVANQWLGIDINTASHVIMVLWYAASIALYVAVIRLATPNQPWTVTIAAAAAAFIPFHISRLATFSLFCKFGGGLARAAGAAVMLGTVFGIARPSRLMLNLAIVAGAACYPPVFIVAVVAAGLAALTAGSLRQIVLECAWLLPGAIAALAIIWLWYPLGVDPRFGPLVSRDDITWAPEIVNLHFPHGLTLAEEIIGWLKSCSIAIVALALQFAVYRGGRLFRANAIVLATGTLTSIAAFLLCPRLYEIERYEFWPRNVVLIVAIAAVIAKAVEYIALRMPRLTTGKLAVLALAAYLGFNAALEGSRIIRAKPRAEARASYVRFGEKVNTLLADSPKDTRLASVGDELYRVPMFAKRPLLLLPSAMAPYHVDFHREAVKRWLATQDAVYATDPAAIRRLRDEFKVRYLSVDRARFDPAKFEQLAGSYMTADLMKERAQPIIKLGPNRPFVLKNPPRDWIAAEDGQYLLIDLNRVE